MQPHMRFKKRSYAFDLSGLGIDGASDWLVENLEEAGVEKPDRLRMRLLLEEALLNFAGHFGAEKTGKAYLERRQGRYRLRLVVSGDRFNPLTAEDEDDLNNLTESLFSVLHMQVQYAYSMGANVLRMSLPKQTWNPVLKIVIAILVGSCIGIVSNIFIPDNLTLAFSDAVLQPISDMWSRLLQAVAGPVIFLTALTASFGTKRIADFGGSRVMTLVRYFSISAIVVVFTMVCSLAIFPLDIAATEANRRLLTTLLDGVLQVVPGNLVEPFSQANTPQLLLIAIVTGYLLAAVEPQVNELNTIIQQLNTLGMTVAKTASWLVPFFVGLILCLKMWTNEVTMLGSIWLPLVLSAAVSAVVLMVALLVSSARSHVNPLVLARKLKDPFVDALKRGTLDYSTVGDLVDSCKKLLGIKGDYARAALPLGLFLYMPTSGVGICVFVVFAAQMQGLSIDQLWILTAVVLSVIMAVATPPMTGANLLSFVAVFSYLGISSDVILDVMVFDIIFGVLCIAFDQAMLQIETIYQAKKMGFLNVEVLRAPL